MLKEMLKNYKKQTFKVATRLVINKYNGCSFYCIYDNHGRICYSK